MIVFRALQGFLGGSMIPTAFTTAFFYFNKQQIVVAAAVVGDLVAGTNIGADGRWLDHRSLFLALAVLHQPCARRLHLGCRAALVKVDRPNLALLRHADYFGIALMALFLGCLEYTLEEGPRWDWFGDTTIRTTAWIAAIAGVGFVYRCLTHDQPVVDLRALKNVNFSLGCFLSFVSGIGIFATIYLTPSFSRAYAASAPPRSA